MYPFTYNSVLNRFYIYLHLLMYFLHLLYTYICILYTKDNEVCIFFVIYFSDQECCNNSRRMFLFQSHYRSNVVESLRRLSSYLNIFTLSTDFEPFEKFTLVHRHFNKFCHITVARTWTISSNSPLIS